jgi:hypothetical protein
MSDGKSLKYLKIVLIILYTVLAITVVAALIQHMNGKFELNSTFIVFNLGIVLMLFGVSGLVYNKIYLKRGPAIEYSSDSIVGKIVNIIISISGLAVIALAIID